MLALATVSLASLWLPIVLSAIAVFLLASVMWMVVGHHAKDWVKLPNEDPVIEALRAQKIGAGQYIFPGCDQREQMNTPEFQAKYAAGPTGYLYVKKPGPFSMGPMLLQSIVFYLVVSTLVAHLATAALPAGAPFKFVFHYVAIATWLAYAAGQTWGAIWSGHSWGHTIRCMVDCLVYAAATGALFAWRWPAS